MGATVSSIALTHANEHSQDDGSLASMNMSDVERERTPAIAAIAHLRGTLWVLVLHHLLKAIGSQTSSSSESTDTLRIGAFAPSSSLHWRSGLCYRINRQRDTLCEAASRSKQASEQAICTGMRRSQPAADRPSIDASCACERVPRARPQRPFRLLRGPTRCLLPHTRAS